MPPDELALLYAVLSLGSFRAETWDPHSGKYRDLGLGHARTPDSQSMRTGETSLALFNMANEQLDLLESSSELAVQALYLCHTFISNTIMSRRSRDYVARAVMMAHEVGLNRVIPSSRPHSDEEYLRRRAILYLYVYFSDVYLAALDSSTPLIKVADFDATVFDRILFRSSTNGATTPTESTVSGLAAFVELVRVQGELLENLHGTAYTESHAELVLRLDSRLNQLRITLGPKTFGQTEAHANMAERARSAGKLLRQIHFNWLGVTMGTHTNSLIGVE